MEKLFTCDLDYSDFKEEPLPVDGELNHVLERIIIYVAQNAGYYSGIVENLEYAALDLQNRYEIIAESGDTVSSAVTLKIGRYIGLCNEIYVYGAGREALKLTRVLESAKVTVRGYIISDQYYDTCNSSLEPLLRLSDCPPGCKIIVALNHANSLEVKEVLEKKGITDVCYMNLESGQED